VESRKEASSQSLPLPTQEDLMLQLNLARYASRPCALSPFSLLVSQANNTICFFNIIRLVALSFGASELTQELYDYTIDLEKTRLGRLDPVPPAQPQK
jgi:hypothetical protein